MAAMGFHRQDLVIHNMPRETGDTSEIVVGTSGQRLATRRGLMPEPMAEVQRRSLRVSRSLAVISRLISYRQDREMEDLVARWVHPSSSSSTQNLRMAV